MAEYKKTENPNIIKQIETVENEIYLDKLEQQVLDTENQIKNIPKEKTKPDQETLDLWNNQHIGFEETDLKNQLKEKTDLLNELRGL